MTVHLSFLLILTGLTGICSMTTISQVSVKAGDSVTIPFLYDSQYMNNVKYLCEGYYWSHCSYAVRTNQPNSGRFSISDDKSRRIFTVTIKDLTERDKYYWCAVEIDGGSDVGEYFHLSVTTGTPSLYVNHQEIAGLNGQNVTINCNYSHSGEIKWCRLGRSCVADQSGSIDGTRVTISKSVPNVFTVTMSGLRTESSSWYYCVKGDFQMPVHLTVTEQPTFSKYSTRHLTTLSPTPEHVSHSSVFASDTHTAQDGHQNPFNFLKSFIIRVSLLIFVMVTLFIWFMFKRYKQTKVESSATTMWSRMQRLMWKEYNILW
ncbi:uncharacterized protein LOC119917588 isoform X3 [Micropterus salmoides]|uniref:uncharacterized protein LOC119917588 isoform X3 n=1 Tax=Micropterus salmoides TaxID=27706 RepID=UPI0018EC8BBA|nr:uncharacterized protein LOC119917588 isoform X3 [Micropterus salmoides]